VASVPYDSPPPKEWLSAWEATQDPRELFAFEIDYLLSELRRAAEIQNKSLNDDFWGGAANGTDSEEDGPGLGVPALGTIGQENGGGLEIGLVGVGKLNRHSSKKALPSESDRTTI